jgi:hypothetical protein
LRKGHTQKLPQSRVLSEINDRSPAMMIQSTCSHRVARVIEVRARQNDSCSTSVADWRCVRLKASQFSKCRNPEVVLPSLFLEGWETTRLQCLHIKPGSPFAFETTSHISFHTKDRLGPLPSQRN